jgi:hypothetical protein
MIWTRISALIVKELLAAFRDPRARVALIVFPLLQLFLFAFAATLEVSNVPVGVLNQDWGMESEQLISRFDRASAFSEVRRYQSLGAAQAAIDRQDIMVVVHIGQDFSRKLAAAEQPSVEILLDGRKSNSAQLVKYPHHHQSFRIGLSPGLGPAASDRDRRSYLVQSEPRLSRGDGADPHRNAADDDGVHDSWHVHCTRTRGWHFRPAAGLATATV